MGEEVSGRKGGVWGCGLHEEVRDGCPDEFPLVVSGCVGEPVLYVCTDIRVPYSEGEIFDVGEGIAVGEAGEGV